jgi:hypothetical protein
LKIKTLIIAIISFLVINLFSVDIFAKPRVRVCVKAPRAGLITIVKTRTCHKWVKGHYRRNRYGRIIWVPGHWRKV